MSSHDAMLKACPSCCAALQAKKAAGEAARAASEGTQLALEAVEASVQHFVAVRDYSRLKDMAEASAVAGQARATQLLLPMLPPSDPARSWRQAAHLYMTAHCPQGETNLPSTWCRLLVRLGEP